jgi:hypothetical protein
MLEELYGFEVVKPNHVKMLLLIMSARLHGPAVAHSELKIDQRLGSWMARKRKLQDNGSGMKTSVNRMQFDELVGQVGATHGEPAKKVKAPAVVIGSNEHICLWGFRGGLLLRDLGLSPVLLADDLVAHGMAPADASATASRGAQRVGMFKRLSFVSWRSGRSICDAAWETQSKASLMSRGDSTHSQSAGRMCLVAQAAGAPPVALQVEMIFVVSFGEGAAEVAFLSGKALLRVPEQDTPFARHFAWPPSVPTIVALTEEVGVETVKLQPVTEVKGREAILDPNLFAAIPTCSIPRLVKETLDLPVLLVELCKEILRAHPALEREGRCCNEGGR